MYIEVANITKHDNSLTLSNDNSSYKFELKLSAELSAELLNQLIRGTLYGRNIIMGSTENGYQLDVRLDYHLADREVVLTPYVIEDKEAIHSAVHSVAHIVLNDVQIKKFTYSLLDIIND